MMGWEYFCAMPGEEAEPWRWVENMSKTLRTRNILEAPPEVSVVHAATPTQQASNRPFGMPLPQPQPPFPAEKIQFLAELGFDQQQAVMALNMTQGDVDQAAGLLFDL